MTYNLRVALLAGLFSLPAMAQERSHWEFAGTKYQVQGADRVSVQVERDRELSLNQMKALCRKGLGLPLRAEYEDQLIKKGLIQERFSTWPITSLKYDLADIQFTQVTQKSAACTATVTDSGLNSNLATTALSYGVAYYNTQQFSVLKQMLPYLMKQPVVSMDAAGLVALLISRQDSDKAQSYFEQYVDIAAISTDAIKLGLAQWQQQNENYEQGLSIAQQCHSPACQQLAIDLEDILLQQEEDSADDLSSYF